jgi:hypothetical protein
MGARPLRRAPVGLYGRVLLTRSKHKQDYQRLIQLDRSPTFQLDQDVIVGPPIASVALCDAKRGASTAAATLLRGAEPKPCPNGSIRSGFLEEKTFKEG